VGTITSASLEPREELAFRETRLRPKDLKGVTRRDFVETAAVVAIGTSVGEAQTAADPGIHSCVLTVNNLRHEVSIDPRATLLDFLREQLHLTGTKKGCDHGQCGACTVIVNGERINSCLALAISLDGSVPREYKPGRAPSRA
jgi:xanthine dehydrogenase YagT iron-sulfur-binding subunit